MTKKAIHCLRLLMKSAMMMNNWGKESILNLEAKLIGLAQAVQPPSCNRNRGRDRTSMRLYKLKYIYKGSYFVLYFKITVVI